MSIHYEALKEKKALKEKEEEKKALKKALEGKCPEDIRIIYEQQMDFVRFHIGLVWQVSSIFIPFSLAGLALDFKTEEQLTFVAYGSIATIVMWTAFSEWHRLLWTHSFYITGYIENIWGVREELPNKSSIFNFKPAKFFGVVSTGAKLDFGRVLRLSFSVAGIILWVVRINIVDTEEGVLACLLS